MHKRTIQKRKARKYLYQKVQREQGFSPEECWNLDHTIIDFVLPRLKYFLNHHCGYPIDSSPEQYKKDLQAIIEGFELHQTYEWYNVNSEQVQKEQKAKELFGKLLYDLWD